jgi:hypothetical protein
MQKIISSPQPPVALPRGAGVNDPTPCSQKFFGCMEWDDSFNENQTYTAIFKCISSGNVITLNKQILINKNTDLNILHMILDIKYATYEHAYRLTVTDDIMIQFSGISVQINNEDYLKNEKDLLLNEVASSVTYSDVVKQAKLVNVPAKSVNPNNIPYSNEYDIYCIYLKNIDGGKLYNYNNKYLLVNKINDYQEVSVYNDIELKTFLVKYTDLEYNYGFIRNIDGIHMYIENNKIVYTETDKLLIKNKNINKYDDKKSDFFLNTKIMTFDLECYREYINDTEYKLIVYACGFYDGRRTYMYYITNYTSQEDMIKTCLFDMMAKRYKGYTIYVHNLGGFDSIYLINEIPKHFKDIDIVNKDNQILSIKVKTNKDNFVDIIFRDSLKLIPGSLRSLAKEFGSSTQKGFFPYSFVKSDNLDYIGNIPNMDYYEKDDKNNPDFLLYYNNFKVAD